MRSLLWGGICAIMATSAVAQSPGTGAIAGRIQDASGAVIGRAQVQATDSATHASRTVTSTGMGEFRLALLPPGVYAISASASGFETALLNSVTVVAGETTTLELKLNVGKANDTIEVTGAADLAQTEGSTLGRA